MMQDPLVRNGPLNITIEHKIIPQTICEKIYDKFITLLNKIKIIDEYLVDIPYIKKILPKKIYEYLFRSILKRRRMKIFFRNMAIEESTKQKYLHIVDLYLYQISGYFNMRILNEDINKYYDGHIPDPKIKMDPYRAHLRYIINTYRDNYCMSPKMFCKSEMVRKEYFYSHVEPRIQNT
jgi:hypothetical protein